MYTKQNASGGDAAPMLLSERMAAQTLGISQRHLFTLRATGKVEAVRLGSRVLYTRDALANLIARNRQPVGAK
jgi:hypothetical protein